MPRAAARHGLVGQVGDGVDGFAADHRHGFMKEGVEEDALEGGDRLRREVVVEREAGLGCRTEEETSE